MRTCGRIFVPTRAASPRQARGRAKGIAGDASALRAADRESAAIECKVRARSTTKVQQSNEHRPSPRQGRRRASKQGVPSNASRNEAGPHGHATNHTPMPTMEIAANTTKSWRRKGDPLRQPVEHS